LVYLRYADDGLRGGIMARKHRDRRKYLAWWQPPDPSTERTHRKFTGADYYFWEGAGGAGFVEAIFKAFLSLVGLAFKGVFAVLKLLLAPFRAKGSNPNDN